VSVAANRVDYVTVRATREVVADAEHPFTVALAVRAVHRSPLIREQSTTTLLTLKPSLRLPHASRTTFEFPVDDSSLGASRS
jgi:hypothetical protein